MQKIKIQRLDKDTDIHKLPEGSFRDALNIRINGTRVDNQGYVENHYGATVIDFDLPAGQNKCIGQLEAKIETKLFFFTWNSFGNHAVWMFDGTTVTNLLTSSILNFQEDDKITGITYLYGNLNWVQKTNPQRTINIDLALKGAYVNVEEFDISFYKVPPQMPLYVKDVEYLTTINDEYYLPNKQNNNTIRKGYLFTYRYLYKGGFYSLFAPFTAGVFAYDVYGFREPLSTKNNLASILPTTTLNLNLRINPYNYYKVGSDLRYNNFVDKIEIAFKDAETGALYITKTITCTESGFIIPSLYGDIFTSTLLDYDIQWNSNEPQTPIDNELANKISESIPRRSGAHSLAKNRLYFGDNLEDFPQWEVSPYVEQVVISPDSNAYSQGAVQDDGTNLVDTYNPYIRKQNNLVPKPGGRIKLGVVFYDEYNRPSNVYPFPPEFDITPFYVGETNKLYLQGVDNEITYGQSYTYTDEIGSYWCSFFKMIGQPPEWATHFAIVRTEDLNYRYFVQGVVNNIRAVNALDTSGNPTSYYDQTNDTITTLTPFIYYNRNPSTFTDFEKLNQLEIQIDNWDSPEGDTIEENKSGYVYEIGDKISFLNTADNLITDVWCGYKDIPILRQDPTTKYLYCDRPYFVRADAPSFPSTIAYFTRGAMVEFTRSRASVANEIYYECGLFYPILNPKTSIRSFPDETIKFNQGDVHRLNVHRKWVNQGTTSANFGISGLGIKETETSINYDQVLVSNTNRYLQLRYLYCMTPSYNNQSGTWIRGNGRANIVSNQPSTEKDKYSGLRYSLPYIVGSSINQTNIFNAENQETLPLEMGRIRVLVQASNSQAESNVMLSVHELDIASLYLGQATINQAGNGVLTANSSNVIGAINPFNKGVGTQDPASIAFEAGNVYGFDQSEGAVWRYAQNGLDVISDNKYLDTNGVEYTRMRTFFRNQKGVSIGIFDKKFNEYRLTIGDKTIHWSETGNSWSSLISVVPELYGRIDLKTFCFKAGTLNLLDSDSSNCNTWFGTTYPSMIKFVANDLSGVVKVLKYLYLTGSKWNARITDGVRETYILSKEFTDNETSFIASVKRDINDPNFASQAISRLSSNRLIKGQVFEVTLEILTKDYTVLREIGVEYTLSRNVIKS